MTIIQMHKINNEIYKETVINKIKYKIDCCFGWLLFLHVQCLWMCLLFNFSFVCRHVYAFAIKSKAHCGSALGPGTSGLPYYCTPIVCIPVVIGG